MKYKDIKAIFDASEALEHLDYETCFENICIGLDFNYRNYELYLILGQYYAYQNAEQAYLCFRQALFYCDVEEDRVIIQQFIKELQKIQPISIPQTAIIIVSFNNKQLTQGCIRSIRENVDKSSYKLILVDNASTDGVCEWLQKQTDIHLIKNTENKGFPKGCNQGIYKAGKEDDILFLNNDTIIPPNALFWLQMGLYEKQTIGATGSVSNSAVNYQQVKEENISIKNWEKYAVKNNIPCSNPYEKKGWLMGFAMLIKRKALEKTGYMDERFSPGNYEDNDLSIRLLMEGWELLLCKNSFIFHYGGSGFKKNMSNYINLLEHNEKKLTEKYNFNYIPYSYVNSNIMNLMKSEQHNFTVLEIECKLGCTLARIESQFPNAQVTGTERIEKLYQLAKNVSNVLQLDFGRNIDVLNQYQYDFIIIDKSLKSWDNPIDILRKAKRMLADGGKIILSLDNVQCRKPNTEQHRKQAASLEEIAIYCSEAGLQISKCSFERVDSPNDLKMEADKKMINDKTEILIEAESYLFVLI